VKYGGWHNADIAHEAEDTLTVDLFRCDLPLDECKCLGEPMNDEIATKIGLPLT
jgi:hypothetical protein